MYQSIAAMPTKGQLSKNSYGPNIWDLDWGGSLPDGLQYMVIGGLDAHPFMDNKPYMADVRITWADGRQVTVPVINGAFGDVRLFPADQHSIPGVRQVAEVP